jgi:CheY-like chemotaxis protein
MDAPELEPTSPPSTQDGSRHARQRKMASSQWRREESRAVDRVLIVEDEPEALEAAVAVFESAGYSVLSATSGAQALELMSLTKDIQVLFADVLMPGMDGASLGREARKVIPDIRVVLVSGSPDRTMTDLDGEPGEFPFLLKPFTMAEVSLLLRR